MMELQKVELHIGMAHLIALVSQKYHSFLHSHTTSTHIPCNFYEIALCFP